MDKSITDNAVEQITVNPDQTAQVVENIDKLNNEPQYLQAVFDPTVITQHSNKPLAEMEGWKEFLHDPWKAQNSNDPYFEKYKPVADLSRDPVWYSLAQKYGKNLVFRTESVIGYYKPAGTGIGRFMDGLAYEADSLRLADARTRLSDARASGNYAEAMQLENQIADLKYKLENTEMPLQSQTWSSIASVAVSSARNLPEVIAANLLSVVSAPFTAGISLWAGRAANVAIIYNDTYNIEFGNILHDIMQRNPDMSEEEARKYADVAATGNALIEALPAAIPGLDLLAGLGQRGAKAVMGKTSKAGFREGFKMLAQKNPEAAKQLLMNLVKVLGKGGVEIGSESIQEVLQYIMGESAVTAASTGGDVLGLSEERLLNFIQNPLAPENRELWETFGYTALGSGAVEGVSSAIFGAIGGIGRRRRARRAAQQQNAEQRGVGALMNLALAEQLHEQRQNSPIPGKAEQQKTLEYTAEMLEKMPEKDREKFLAELGIQAEQNAQWRDILDKQDLRTRLYNAFWERAQERGIAPEKVYLDREMAKTLMEDPTVAEAMAQLGVQSALQESNDNGGLVELDFAKYDEVVNSNDELFQKIKAAVSFSPETLTFNQFQAYINSLDKNASTEIQRAREYSDSVYNRILAMLNRQNVDQKSAEAYAVIMQFLANRAGAFRLGEPRTGEQAVGRLEFRMPGQEPFGLGQAETTAPQQKTPFELRQERQTAVQIFENTNKFVGEQAYNAAQADPSLIPAGEENGVPYDAQDFGRAVNDEIEELRSEESYPRGRPKSAFESNSPIRQAARKWLTEDEQGKSFYDRAKKEAADVDTAVASEQSAETALGDTIVVDGVERPTKNSDGELIANTEESLTNFWRWFGDSKVVDENGRPLVVYHGTPEEIDQFLKETIGKSTSKNTALLKLGGGFYTTNVRAEAGGYGKQMALYVSIKNPIYTTANYSKNITKEQRQQLYDYLKDVAWRSDGRFRDNLTSNDDMFLQELYYDIKYDVRNEKFGEAIQKVLGVDGIINEVKGSKHEGGLFEYVFFEPTQAKRTDNLGTWSPTDARLLNQFIGGRAIEEMNLGDQLENAKARIAAGVDPETVRQETGFYQEADGSWVFEISDADMKARRGSKFIKADDGTLAARGVTTLGEIIDAPTLFKAVPWIKNLEVEIKNKKGETWGEASSNKIWLYASKLQTEDEMLDTLAHEIQHILQHHYEFMYRGKSAKPKSGKRTFVYNPTKTLQGMASEGYKRLTEVARSLYNKVAPLSPTLEDWGSTRRMMELYGRRGQLQQWAKDGVLDQAEVDEFVDLYQKFGDIELGLAGSFGDYLASGWEYMARNTATRRTLTEEERRATSPAATRDIEGNVWIMNVGGNTNYTPAALPGGPIKEGGPTKFSTQVPGEGYVAGRFYREGDKLIIELTPNANPTTLVHEMFHWFSYELQEAYNSGQMTDYWKGKTEALAKMVDAKLEVDPADPTVTRLHLTKEQEEKAANMFLEYIREGKVQNREVRTLFSYLQDVFRKIFKLLGLTQYKLSKESLELFGSIFETQDVIENEQRLVGIFQIVKPENADQGLYDMYTGEMLNSRVRATQKLHKTWAGIEKYRASDDYAKKYQETRLQVAQELNQDMRYIVLEEAQKHGNNPEATWADLQTNPETADLDLTIEQVADIIATTPDKTTEIDRITEQRMNQHIMERFKITPEELGLKASRNSSKVRALLAEALMREGKTLADFDAEYSDLLKRADAQVAKSSLNRLADKEYWDTLEARAVEHYAFAMANGDEKAMAEARRDQAMINAIRMRAESIATRARRFQEMAAEFRGAQKKVPTENPITGKKTAEYQYAARDYDLLQSILEAFGFPINYARRKTTPVGEKLDAWIDEQEITTMTRAGELRNFIPFVQEGFQGDFPKMTGADFEKLEAVFNAVKSVAGVKFAILFKNEKILLSNLVAMTNDKMKEMGLDPFQKKDSYWAKHFGIMGSFTNPEPILRALFPAEVLDKVWLPFINAAVNAERVGGEWVNKYRLAKSKVDLSNKTKTYSTGHTMSNKQVADLLLSMGNAHAYENFRIAFGSEEGPMTEAQAETIVSEALQDQPALAQFVNDVWAIYAEATVKLDEEFEARTNTLFVEKEHRSFEINGIKFGGGYVPARKALDYVPTDVRAHNEGGMVHDKKFEKLVTKAPDGNVRSIVDITENELFQSAKQGMTAVEYNNARKYLLADGTKAAIGERAFTFISQWLEGYIATKYDTSGWVRPLASLTTMGALGFRLSTALLQLSGLGPAMAEIGPRYFARGLWMAMKNGEWAPVFATRKGADKSDYMKVRIADPRSSLLGQSITDSVRAQDANTKAGRIIKYTFGKLGQGAMWGIQYVDTIVANITWNGAYLKALDSGKSEMEARREADSVVRVVQSDSLEVSRSQAMQAPLARMITAFATWIMAMQSQMRALIGTKKYSKALVFGAMYMLLSPIFESFLKEATKIGGSDDDDEYLERVMKTCYNEVASTVGNTFLPVGGFGGAALTAILSGLEEGITDEREIFEVRQSNVPAFQTAYRALNTVRHTLAGNLEKAATYGASTVSTEAGRLVKYLLAE